ncbi:hypothetical protein BG74_01055 [Sodalis-like endosymbiont of Proechinophthirus fluctus]|nr:hypothetical protein BG74_01055 [Sodalis-like endosymbiont of Proechinophthirus fluctus]
MSRADVVLPNDVQVLHGDFLPECLVPALINRLFRPPVIAEGVENTAQCNCLLGHHIHRGQGYLFAEPLTQ